MSRLAYWFGSGLNGILDMLITLLCVFLSLTVHEFCHGYMAYLRGDNTAQRAGRLSLNPIRHIDPIGALCLFLFGFGWAKPVSVNPINFRRKTIKLDMVLTAIAGPLSNFLLAFISMFIVVSIYVFGGSNKWAYLAYQIFETLTVMNLGLGLFNLIPIPPLDGSKVLSAVLPTKYYFKLMQYENFGFIALIILINLPIFNSLLNWALSGIYVAFWYGSGAILGLFL